ERNRKTQRCQEKQHLFHDVSIEATRSDRAARQGRDILPSRNGRLDAAARDADGMFEIERLIEDCRKALVEPLPQSAIKEIVARATSRPGEIVTTLGAPKWGGLNTLYRSPELTILNIIWSPCMTLYPHDHRMWAVIGLYGGREDNAFYRRTPDGLQP